MARGSFYSFLRERNIMVLISCRILWGLTQALFMPYFSLFALAQEGVTNELLGLAISVKAIGTAILAPLAGYMADSIGRKKMIFAGTILHAISYLFYLAARDFRMIFVGSLFEGLSIVHLPALQAITHDSLVKSRRGLGLSATVGLQALPSLVSPFIGGVFAEELGIDMGMRIGFALAFAVGVAVAFIRLRFLRETLNDNRMKAESGSLFALMKESYASMFGLLREYRALKGLIVLSAIDTFFTAITAPFWIVYAKAIIGLSAFEWGIIEVVAAAVSTLVLIFSGGFADRYGSKGVMLVNLFLAPWINLSFIFCESFAHVAVFRVLLAIQNAFTMPAATALVADIVPRESRGRAVAAVGWQPIVLSLGAISTGFFRFPPYFLGSALSGYVYSLDARYPWLLLAGGYAFGFVVCWFLVNEPEEPEE